MRLDVVGWVNSRDSQQFSLNVTSATRAMWAHCPVSALSRGGRGWWARVDMPGLGPLQCPIAAQAVGSCVESSRCPGPCRYPAV